MNLVFTAALEQTQENPSRSHCCPDAAPKFYSGRFSEIAVFQNLLKRDSGGGEAVHESR
jgi:hypothetical protein